MFLNLPDGTARLLVPNRPGSVVISNIAWSADGTQLAYTIQTGNQEKIWVLTLGGSPATEPLLGGPASAFSPAFSPDGRWFAYVSDDSGRREVYVQRVSLAPGTRLGVHEIIAAIGEGGPAFADRGVPPQLRRVLRSHEWTAR